MKSPRIAVLGSVHMDLIARAGALPDKGMSVVGHGFSMAPGGKGGNQACQCAAMDAETLMLTRLGNDIFGRELLGALRAKGVDTQHVKFDDELATGASTVLSAGDGYSSIIFPGAAGAMLPQDIDEAISSAGRLDAMILQLELPLPLVLHAALAASQAGMQVVLNYSPAPKAISPLIEKLLQSVSLLVANEAEAMTLLAQSGQPRGGNAAQELCRLGPSSIIVTAGPRGCTAWHERKLWQQPAFEVDVVDTVGAGDAFLGAAVVRLAEGADMGDALEFGAAAGAIAVGRAGAVGALPERAEIIQFLAERASA